ncbi:MAG: rod shape-determining protein MreC [Alphaproteobacteria bacterium]
MTPAILILLAVSLMIVHRTDTVPVEKLRIAMTDAVAPVMSAITRPFETMADSFSGIKTMRQLKAENIRLKAENERLQQWYDAALKYQAQNKSLQDLLNVKADAALTFVTTRVVSDPGGSFVKSVLLPVGVGDNVGKGNAVMSGRGLIGRVTEVGQRSARVLLVTDLNSRIPVIVQNTRTHAILAGKNTSLLRLERLPIDSSLSVGQRIVTSGDGGQLPPDIPIGTIVEVGPAGVIVQPLADIETVTYVQVINAQVDQGLMTGEITPAQPKHGKR